MQHLFDDREGLLQRHVRIRHQCTPGRIALKGELLLRVDHLLDVFLKIGCLLRLLELLDDVGMEHLVGVQGVRLGHATLRNADGLVGRHVDQPEGIARQPTVPWHATQRPQLYDLFVTVCCQHFASKPPRALPRPPVGCAALNHLLFNAAHATILFSRRNATSTEPHVKPVAERWIAGREAFEFGLSRHTNAGVAPTVEYEGPPAGLPTAVVDQQQPVCTLEHPPAGHVKRGVVRARPEQQKVARGPLGVARNGHRIVQDLTFLFLPL
mmetsp:Transcript_24395/g.70391  ORF Transcript_24395/g.70391 Transcript_24395/m.70391 type:complete len:268 (+) Transcript_24395:1210-2013(+)